jgi:prevent-host-death family protein
MKVGVHEAKTQLSHLLDLVERGEEVLIVRHGKPVAQLVRASAAGKPVLGGLAGTVTFHKGWDQPMTDEEAEAFWAGR